MCYEKPQNHQNTFSPLGCTGQPVQNRHHCKTEACFWAILLWIKYLWEMLVYGISLLLIILVKLFTYYHCAGAHYSMPHI